jgi:hypothetical protein
MLGGSAIALLALFVGCSHIPGVPARAAPPDLAAAAAPQVAIQLQDVPQGTTIAQDLAPSDAQLAGLLGGNQVTSELTQMGRQGGIVRTFTYVSPEPGVLNGTVRVTIEVDVFATPTGALAWESARATLAQADGPPLVVAAPGTMHHVHMRASVAGDMVATLTTLTFVEGNVAVAVTTLFVGPNTSIADAERYADLIDQRIRQPGG